MPAAALREAAGLLGRSPVLWIPGIAGGAFVSAMWLTYFISGSFFTSRLVVIFPLILLLFTTGMMAAIKENDTGIRALLAGGVKYYFRVLLPQLFLTFSIVLVFIVCTIVFSLLGLGSDIGLVTSLSFGIMIPTLMLTFFFDTAAVFEDQKVFASIQRSILLVSGHMMETLTFFIISALICAGVSFGLMIVWEAILFEKLKPIMDFTDAQREAFTPEQFIAMIGQDGIYVTAIILFIGVLILLPLMVSYKACFFRKMAGSSPAGDQMTYGEYDSKGRWYKY